MAQPRRCSAHHGGVGVEVGAFARFALYSHELALWYAVRMLFGSADGDAGRVGVFAARLTYIYVLLTDGFGLNAADPVEVVSDIKYHGTDAASLDLHFDSMMQAAYSPLKG